MAIPTNKGKGTLPDSVIGSNLPSNSTITGGAYGYSSGASNSADAILRTIRSRDEGLVSQESYSLAEIILMDGSKIEFMAKASPSVVPYLTRDMKNNGYLIMWNDTDTICIPASNVKHFSMRSVTK